MIVRGDMVTMCTFELIDKVFVNFIRFIIVVIELKICIDMLTACMEYNIRYLLLSTLTARCLRETNELFFLISVLT